MTLRARVGQSLQDAQNQVPRSDRLPLPLDICRAPLREVQGYLHLLVKVWELTLDLPETDIKVGPAFTCCVNGELFRQKQCTEAEAAWFPMPFG